MIILKKLILIALVLASATSLYSQEVKNCEKIIYDIDSIPILISKGKFDYELNSDSTYYLLRDGEKIFVNKNISYWNGDRELNAFIDFLYYQRFNYNHQEINDIIRYCIIFDNYKNIKDIRFLKRFHGVNDNVKNYMMVFQILLNTEGQWAIQKKTHNTWYVYFGSHKFF